MNLNTEKKYQEFIAAVAKQNQVTDPTKKFTVTPNAEQKIIKQLRESNDFMRSINVMPVKNQSGESIGLGVSGMIASRTNTAAGNPRTTKAVYGMESMPYKTEQTNFDTHITYAQLDAFAHFPNFNQLISQETKDQIYQNKVSIGFYGTSVALTTDPVANPNGEDVNKGWFQALREHHGDGMLAEGATADEIRIGEGGDFLNLDLAVMAVKHLLPQSSINNPNNVAIIGTDLLAFDEAKLYAAQAETPSEKTRIQMAQVIGTYGGLTAVTVPGFPSRGILVGPLKNLSIYILEGSTRRSIGKKNDEYDRIDNFESMSMAYVLERPKASAALEFDNVKLLINGVWQ